MEASLKTMPKKALLIALGFVLAIVCIPAFAFAEGGSGEKTPVAYQVPAFVDATHPEAGMTWSTQYCSDYTALTSDLKNWNNQTIVASGNINTSEIVVSGTVNLILTDGCNLNVYKTYKQAIHVLDGSTLNIYGQQNNSGYLMAKSSSSGAGIGGAKNESGGAINIYGGTIDAFANEGTGTDKVGAGIGAGGNGTGSNIAIYGGNVTATSSAGAGIGGGVQGSCNGIKIYGGTISAVGGTNAAAIGSGGQSGSYYPSAQNIFIYGGTIEAKGSSDAAAIGGGYKAEAKGLYLYGGQVVSKAGKNASGFGSGREASCDGIYVSGGTYSCTANSKATGIGCGFKGNAKNIVISGGTITIEGTEEAAAIGCSYGGSAENITISGGVLNVTGGSCGAGIGAGKEASVKNIVISGGTINATGGSKGAGIGGGFKGSCDGIDISGGSIVATGGVEAAGIGGSYETAVSNIAISSCMVTAVGGEYAAAIGGGKEGTASNISFASAVVRALRSQSGNPSIGSGQNGTFSNITVSGAGAQVFNLTEGTVVSGAGDITSKMGDFDVAITNGTIAARGITTTITGFALTVSSDDQKRVESMLPRVSIVASGGFTLLESQAQLAAMILGYSEDEMTEIILDPDKTIDLSLEIQIEVVGTDFMDPAKPVIEYAMKTIATCVLHSGTDSTTVNKVLDPEDFQNARGILTVTLPVPAGVDPEFVLHTSDDGTVTYDVFMMGGDSSFEYDSAAGIVTVTINHCSHLKTSFSVAQPVPATGDNAAGLLMFAFGAALCAAALVLALRKNLSK